MLSNTTLNEYVWSSIVTFVAAFGAAVLPTIGAGVPVTSALIFAAVAVGVRAGVRAVINYLAT